MYRIWLDGSSLQTRIQTRLAIIDDMKSYNDSIGLLGGASLYSEQSKANADNANANLVASVGVAQDRKSVV